MDMKHMDPMYRAAHGVLDPEYRPRSRHRTTVDLVTRCCTSHVADREFPAHLLCELVLPLLNGHA